MLLIATHGPLCFARRAYLERKPSHEECLDLSPLEHEGQALQAKAQPGDVDASTMAARLQDGLTHLDSCASSAGSTAAQPLLQHQQPSLLLQLLHDGRSNVTGVGHALCALEASLCTLQQALQSGEALAGLAPTDARTQLHSHASHMLGELASASSKLRSLQDLLHCCNARPVQQGGWS